MNGCENKIELVGEILLKLITELEKLELKIDVLNIKLEKLVGNLYLVEEVLHEEDEIESDD